MNNEDIKSTQQEKGIDKKNTKALILVVIMLFFIFVVAVSTSGKNSRENSPKITKAEFEEIRVGMNRSEVVEIIGGSGELLSESGSAEVYMWEGSGSLGANANITFSNGKVHTKAQYGLK